jgi:hypothetical protein
LLPNSYELAHHVLFSSSIILQGITAFALSEALNHQRKYRSSAPSVPSAPPPKQERDPLLSRSPSSSPLPSSKGPERELGRSDMDVFQWLKRFLFMEDFIFFLFFIVFLVFLYLALMYAFLLQRLNPFIRIILFFHPFTFQTYADLCTLCYQSCSLNYFF